MSTYKSEGPTYGRVGKFECVSYVMTIAPALNIYREERGAKGILLLIYDGAYVFICTVYSSVFKEVTKHPFVCDFNFSKKTKSE